MKKYLMLLFLAVLLTPPLAAQVKLQVVTQSLEKDLTGIRKVVINGKKADVIIHGWTKTGVSAQIRRVAKHPDRDVAELELNFMLYKIGAQDGVLTLTNGFRIPQNRRSVQSQLKTVFELWVPENTGLQIDNSFGDITLANLRGETSVTFEFGKLSLSDLTGKLTIQSEYGDLEATDVGGQLVCKAEKADIILRQLSGTARIESRYGKLYVRPAERLSSLTVSAARTEIYLYTRRVDDFQYEVETTYSTLKVPDSHQPFVRKLRFDHQPAGNRPAVRIDGSYSPVTLIQSAGDMLIKN
ncbi:DUF4097 family beta strand repeat-containing protein [Tellurirhabdus rosea]|uniref:DUF4097 family beta strand repeat-containing protein n=1 Tax=Tellurirhabdus rosea TaxID=2674997 RepID=UPI00225447AA|nr:DUF4097 family beta strand repeat-containing protein [Tellurirhabdus rosea]